MRELTASWKALLRINITQKYKFLIVYTCLRAHLKGLLSGWWEVPCKEREADQKKGQMGGKDKCLLLRRKITVLPKIQQLSSSWSENPVKLK